LNIVVSKSCILGQPSLAQDHEGEEESDASDDPEVIAEAQVREAVNSG